MKVFFLGEGGETQFAACLLFVSVSVSVSLPVSHIPMLTLTQSHMLSQRDGPAPDGGEL